MSVFNPGENEKDTLHFDSLKAEIGPSVGFYDSNDTVSYDVVRSNVVIGPKGSWSTSFPSGELSEGEMESWNEYGPCLRVVFMDDSEIVAVALSRMPLLEDIPAGNGSLPLDFEFQ